MPLIREELVNLGVSIPGQDPDTVRLELETTLVDEINPSP